MAVPVTLTAVAVAIEIGVAVAVAEIVVVIVEQYSTVIAEMLVYRQLNYCVIGLEEGVSSRHVAPSIIDDIVTQFKARHSCIVRDADVCGAVIYVSASSSYEILPK